MNAGPTSERVYHALRRQLLERAYRPGERLDPARIGDRLASSATPARDALNVLAGEGLVESRTSDGFSVPVLDEPSLVDRYRWTGTVVMAAARTAVSTHPELPDLAGMAPADATSSLFHTVAARTRNPECIRTIADLNARLHAVRTVEPLVIDRVAEELSGLAAYYLAGDLPRFRRALARFHQVRERSAAAVVRAMYRGERA